MCEHVDHKLWPAAHTIIKQQRWAYTKRAGVQTLINRVKILNWTHLKTRSDCYLEKNISLAEIKAAELCQFYFFKKMNITFLLLQLGDWKFEPITIVVYSKYFWALSSHNNQIKGFYHYLFHWGVTRCTVTFPKVSQLMPISKHLASPLCLKSMS